MTSTKYVLHLIQMFHFKFCIYLGSKFAPYGKDGCAGIKPEDQSDNSAMSTTGRRRGNMVNRVNSTDNQCFFEGSSQDTVQDFLIKLGIKPCMHLWEIKYFFTK